jgi:hypothetical protein
MSSERYRRRPLFSQGAQNVIEGLTPYTRAGEQLFPRTWDSAHGAFDSRQSLHEWFVKNVDQVGDPSHCQIEPNVAAFMRVEWREDSQIVAASCQVMVVDGGTLEDYYLDQSYAAQYLRFDYHPHAPGRMFREPMPHVHIRADGEPRFGWPCGSANMVVDFLEMLYLNYHYGQWLRWARSIWEDVIRECKVKEDPFDRIFGAYQKGEWSLLEPHRVLLACFRAALRSEKDSAIRLRVPDAPRSTVTYPDR